MTRRHASLLVWMVVTALPCFRSGLEAQTTTTTGLGRLVYNRAYSNSHIERASGVALDATGVYMVGTPLPDGSLPGGPIPVLLRKADSDGNELWVRNLGRSPLYFKPFGIAAYGGAIYIAGSLITNTGDSEALVSKFDSEGNLQWDRRFNTRYADAAFGITADSTGLYVAGDAGPLLSSTRDNALFIRKYSFDGTESWTWQEVGWGSGLTGGIAVDSTGVYTVYVAPEGATLRKHDKSGRELWRRPLPAAPEMDTNVATDGSGSVYVARGGILVKYDFSGNLWWFREFSDRGFGVAVDGSGVYVAGSVARPLPGQCALGGSDGVAARYDASGNLIWRRQFGTTGGDVAATVAVAPDDVYVGGFRSTNSPYRLESATLARFAKDAATFPPGPRIQWDCVLNAASLIGGAVSPGELVTIRGADLSEAVLQVQPDLAYPREALGSRVLFDGISAPLLYVSPTQINAIVPFAVEGRSAVQVQVERNGARSEPLTMPVAPLHPGLFTLDSAGTGQLLAVDEYGLNSHERPVRRGSVITLLGTGAGLTNPAGSDGVRHVFGELPELVSIPVVAFARAQPEDGADAVRAEVLFSGGVHGAVAGIFQITLRVPDEAAVADAVPVYVFMGSSRVQPDVTISIE